MGFTCAISDESVFKCSILTAIVADYLHFKTTTSRHVRDILIDNVSILSSYNLKYSKNNEKYI